MKLCDRYGTGLVFPSQGKKKILNEPSLQGNECKDHPAARLERKHLLFSVYCTQTGGTGFQLHLDYVSEEPDSLQVCGRGTVQWSEKMREGRPLGLLLQRDLCLNSVPTCFWGKVPYLTLDKGLLAPPQLVTSVCQASHPG